MSRATLGAILVASLLNDKEDTKLINKFMRSDTNIGKAMAEAQTRREEEAQDELVAELSMLLSKAEERTARKIKEIRDYRRMIQIEKKILKKIDEAVEYAAETGNIFPLAALVDGWYHEYGLSVENWDKLSIVPKGWKKTNSASPKESKPNW